MNEQDIFDRGLARKREKQALCNHPSLKCSICGLYKDNLFNEYQAKIEILLVILDIYNNLLCEKSIPHIEYRHAIQNGIIEQWKKEKIRKLVLHERTPDQLI